MQLSTLLKKVKRRLIPVKVTTEPEKFNRYKKWFDDQGDKTHRVNYPLTRDSVVVDLGGYEGQWACDIYCKYGSRIFVFEPAKKYYDGIVSRFAFNPAIKVYLFGLAASDSQEKLFMQNDSSSIFNQKSVGQHEIIELKEAASFLDQLGLDQVDLMKINIEGGEYDLLNHLIESGWIRKIKNVQVQFHDFVPDAKRRMKSIQEKLIATHELTYQYWFVWENWRLKES